MTRGLPKGRRWARSGEHQGEDHESAGEQQQQVSKPEPSLMLTRNLDQVAYRGKLESRRIAALDEVKYQRHRHRWEAEQNPRIKESDHTSPDGRATTRRRARPKGVSVVM